MKTRLFLLFAWAGIALSAGEAAPLDITVDAAAVTGQTPPMWFGHNMEAADPRVRPENKFHLKTLTHGQGFWNPETAKPFPAVAAQLKRMGISALRYPGGCYAHNFDWRKAVGPREKRGIWKFGINEYIALCRSLGAEPVITLTDYALPAEELPRHLAELVEYLNAPATPKHPWAMKRAEWGNPEPYGVKYFELGNESDHGNHNHQPGRRFTPDGYIRYFNESAALVRAVDASVQLGLVLVPGHEYDQAWNHKVLKACGKQADFIVCHFYDPRLDSGSGPAANLQAAMSYGDRLQRVITGFRALIDSETGRELPIAVTEYNLHHNEKWRFSFLGGLVIADTLRVFARPENRIFLCNYWYILNDFWGAIRTDYTDKVEKTAVVAFFEAMARYAGRDTVACRYQAPLLESPAVGGYEAARGTKIVKGGAYGAPLTLGAFRMREFEGMPGIAATAKGKDALALRFDERKDPAYINFSVIQRPEGEETGKPMLLELSFEARFTPAPGCDSAATMGLGLVDRRGWNATKSGIPVRGAEGSTDWKPHSGVMTTRGDCPGLFLVARLEMVDKPVSGVLEFRNIQLRPYHAGSWPAYPGAEALAMHSADGKRLTLLVFNKSSKDSLPARIRLEHFEAKTGAFSEFHRDDAASTQYFEPATGNVTVTDGRFERLLPPLSFTAFEFCEKQ